ncbi:MAG: ABC transporter permease [Spirochaetia bacterium]|nr:ABC transporter permease [Spirochaetia bacterium]
MKPSPRILYIALVSLAAAVAAIGIAAIVLAILGANVFDTFKVILTEPLKDIFGITEILVRAIPLILVGLGIAISFRSGILNIGAEGQILMGIIAAAATAIALPGLPKIVLLPIVFLAGALGGAVWGAIAGYLRAVLGVNEILSTVMLNYIAAQLYGFLLRGPMIDPAELQTGSGTPQSVRLPRSAWIDRIIPGTRLHWGIAVALVLAVLVYILLWRTTWGFKMRAAGAGAKAARYGGIKVEQCLLMAMVLAGAFAGLAGAVEVTGVHRRAIEGISSGYGFSGIVVALFGGLHPAGIVPSAFFFGLLLIGADMTQRMMSIPANMVLVLQGAVILSIISAKMVINDPYAFDKFSRALSRRRKKDESGKTTGETA